MTGRTGRGDAGGVRENGRDRVALRPAFDPRHEHEDRADGRERELGWLQQVVQVLHRQGDRSSQPATSGSRGREASHANDASAPAMARTTEG